MFPTRDGGTWQKADPFMFLSSLLATLAAFSGRRPQQPNFDGLLDELYAIWPLDADELQSARRPC